MNFWIKNSKGNSWKGMTCINFCSNLVCEDPIIINVLNSSDCSFCPGQDNFYILNQTVFSRSETFYIFITTTENDVLNQKSKNELAKNMTCIFFS